MSRTSLNRRREVTGAARSSSPWMLSVLVGFDVSIIGDSPLTVTLSCTLLRVISMSTLNVLPARIRMPSRL